MALAEKVSISVSADDLKWLRRRAKRHRGNLSAVFAEATRLLRQRDAQERLLEAFGTESEPSAEETEAIRAEWRG
jgi:hypothetical protein